MAESTIWCRFQADDTASFGIVEGDRGSQVDGSPFAEHAITTNSRPLDAVKLAPGVRTGTSNMATTGAFAIQPEEGVQAPYLLILDRQYLFRLVAQLLAR